MREIKFRQWHQGRVHYWGFRDGYFVGPVTNNQPNPTHEQFTGLTDVNGVEIYEGDLLECNSGYLWVVSFDNQGSFIAHAPDNINACVMLDDYDFKVIGNIHQHPELLK